MVYSEYRPESLHISYRLRSFYEQELLIVGRRMQSH